MEESENTVTLRYENWKNWENHQIIPHLTSPPTFHDFTLNYEFISFHPASPEVMNVKKEVKKQQRNNYSQDTFTTFSIFLACLTHNFLFQLFSNSYNRKLTVKSEQIDMFESKPQKHVNK